MKHSRKWISALLTVQVLVSVTALMAFEHGPGDIVQMLAISVPFAQGSLLGIWAAMGGRPGPWRLVAAALALVGAAKVTEAITSDGEVVLCFFLLAQLFSTSLPLFLLRFLGLDLIRPRDDVRVAQAPTLQFSLRSLLEWTTAVAVLLGTLPMLPEEAYMMMSMSDLAFVMGVFVPMGLLAVAAAWAGLGAGRLWVRLLALGIAGPIMAIVTELVKPGAWPGWVCLLFACWTTWTVASLWVFRLAGYRLTRRARAGRGKSTESGLETGSVNVDPPEVTAE